MLASTLYEQHPDATMSAVLLDERPDALGQVPGVRMLALEEVLGDGWEFTAAGNSPLALKAATLPHLLRRVLNEGAGSVVYLACGQRVLQPLDDLWSLLQAHAIVLVPRVGARESSDAATVVAKASRRGVFNSHLFGVSASGAADRLLESWPRWFADGPDHAAGAIQGWFDGLTADFEDVAVLRQPRSGLDADALGSGLEGRSGGSLRFDGRAVLSFDFSEQDPLHPRAFCEGYDRAPLSGVPALAELCDLHARELLAAGFRDDARRRRRFEEFDDGARLTPVIRKLVIAGLESGDLVQSPYLDAGRTQLYDYLNQPAKQGKAVGLTRLHMAIWHGRHDLQIAYPHIDGPDGVGYAGWLWVHGTSEEGLSTALLPPVPPHIYPDQETLGSQPQWGVNVAGFLTSELGLGEAARLLIAGLDAKKIPALPIQARLVPPCRQDADFTFVGPDHAIYPTNIVCMNGDAIPPFAREVGKQFFEGRHTIALWWWEVGEFPADWHDAFAYIDEVWVASEHIRQTIAPVSPVPVVNVTMPVALPTVPARSRAELGATARRISLSLSLRLPLNRRAQEPRWCCRGVQASLPARQRREARVEVDQR